MKPTANLNATLAILARTLCYQRFKVLEIQICFDLLHIFEYLLQVLYEIFVGVYDV